MSDKCQQVRAIIIRFQYTTWNFFHAHVCDVVRHDEKFQDVDCSHVMEMSLSTCTGPKLGYLAPW